MENADFVDIFFSGGGGGVIKKLDYFWGSFVCIYRSFTIRSRYRTGIFFWLAYLFIFGGGWWGWCK